MNESLGLGLVVVSSAVEGFAQVCLKRSALATVGKMAWIATAVAFFIVDAVLYTGALRWLDVSTAYPVGALSFASVVLFSRLILKEEVDARRWFGLALILLGCALVAKQG